MVKIDVWLGYFEESVKAAFEENRFQSTGS